MDIEEKAPSLAPDVHEPTSKVGDTCGSCRFARKANPVDFSKNAQYLCTRFPPQVSAFPMPVGGGKVQMTRDSAYPTVMANSFACGEWQIKPGLAQ